MTVSMPVERQGPRIDPNKAVRRYVEKGAEAWQHKGVAAELYAWSDVFKFYWFSPESEYQAAIPNLVIGVEPMRVNVLAGYHLKENAVGLPYEITFNERYMARPLYAILETAVHEMVHLYQENTPGLMPCKNNYHNQQFVAICEEIGLHPRLGSGAHWKAADGQFAGLMERYGVPRPEEASEVPPESPKTDWWDDYEGKGKGKSTLILYMSPSCTRKPECKLRSGRADLNIRCSECGGEFKPRL